MHPDRVEQVSGTTAMNRLAYNRCYLCGAMDRVADGGVGWRERIKLDLRDLHIIWLDPCNKPINIATEDAGTRRRLNDAKMIGDYDFVHDAVKEIRGVDLRMCHISDFLLVNIDTDVHACGTYDEISIANTQKKPIIIHCEQGKAHLPNWMFAMLPHQFFFSTWEEACEYLQHVAHAPEVDWLKRWYFFNFQGDKAPPQ